MNKSNFEAAKKHIDLIWPNVSQWWNSEEVQNARIEFCNNYALIKSSKDGINILSEALSS